MVALVLSRRYPRIDPGVWCEILDVTPADVRASLARLQAARAPAAKTQGGAGSRSSECPYCGRRVQHGVRWQRHMADLHEAAWSAHLDGLEIPE